MESDAQNNGSFVISRRLNVIESTELSVRVDPTSHEAEHDSVPQHRRVSFQLWFCNDYYDLAFRFSNA